MTATLRSCLDLLRLAWAHGRLKLAVAAVLKAGEAGALPLSAAALGALTDAAVDGDIARTTMAAAAVALVTVAGLTLGHFAHVAFHELGELNLLAMTRDLVEVSNGSPGLAHHERPEYADKVQVVEQEMRRVSETGMEALLSTASHTIAIGVTCVLLGRLDPVLVLLPLAAVPPILLGQRAEKLRAVARESAAQSARRADHLFALATTTSTAPEIRLYRLGDELCVRHADCWQTTTDTLRHAETHAALLRCAGQILFALAYIAAALLVVHDAVAGRRTAGELILAFSLAALVNGQVTAMMTDLADLQRMGQTMVTFRELRAMVTPTPGTPTRTPNPPTGTPIPLRMRHGIQLHDLTFTYPGTDRPVLDAVNLHLPAGATVALVGENGAGKTSLVKLLCRLYEPTCGTITVDGIDLRRSTPDAWLRRVACAFQDFARFEFLARETVGVGDLSMIDIDGAVRAAVYRAHSANVIDHLAHGLDTRLGTSHTDGTELSGGQWQKLALGRAMMREHPLLLVLDEPTSALDAHAEYLLFKRYADSATRVAARTGAVTLLVSHRFSTVRMADLIVVIDNGRVVETGTHDALMTLDGRYAELYNLHSAAYG